MALVSTALNADDRATAAQCNNLRSDVTAHTHEGTDTALVKADNIQTVTNSRQHAIPTVANDTFTLNAAAQTLSNKTLANLNGRFYPGTDVPGSQTTGYLTCEADGDFVFTGGKIGVGVSPTNGRLVVGANVDNAANVTHEIGAMLTVATGTAETVVLRAQLQPSATVAIAGTSPLSAIDGDVLVQSTNTQNWSNVTLVGVNGYIGVEAGASGTIATMVCVQTSGQIFGGTVTDVRGLNVTDMQPGAGVVTTQYGIYINALAKGVTNWGIYSVSASWYSGGIFELANQLKMPNNTDIQMKNAAGAYRSILYVSAADTVNISNDGLDVRFGGGISTTGRIYPGTGSAVQTTYYLLSNTGIDVVGGALRVTGSSNPVGGAGLELHWDNTSAYVQGYNRGSSAYVPLLLIGSTVTLYAGANARLLADATGVKVTSGYSAGTVGALDDYDDAMILHRGLSQGQAEALLAVGALEKHGELLMWDIERTIMLLGGGIYQTRQKHDLEIADLRARLSRLEAGN